MNAEYHSDRMKYFSWNLLAAFAKLTLATNLIVNGDFELYSSNLLCNKSLCILTDNKAIAPWFSSTGSFEIGKTHLILARSKPPAKSGSWSIDLISTTPYAIYQTVPTVFGQRYNLTFYLNQKLSCTQVGIIGYVGVTGSPDYPFSHDSNRWTSISYDFEARSSMTNITIGSNVANSCGPLIDLVSLEKVPLIINGDFESIRCPEKRCVTNIGNLKPWNTNTATGKVAIYSNAKSGSTSFSLVCLNSIECMIYQTVPTLIGRSYNLTFYVLQESLIPFGGLVEATGSARYPFGWKKSAGWTLVSYQFNAINSDTKISFRSTNFGDDAPIIDLVSLEIMALP